MDWEEAYASKKTVGKRMPKKILPLSDHSLKFPHKRNGFCLAWKPILTKVRSQPKCCGSKLICGCTGLKLICFVFLYFLIHYHNNYVNKEKRKSNKFKTGLPWDLIICFYELRSSHLQFNLPTPTRRHIKSSRNISKLVFNPVQLIRS